METVSAGGAGGQLLASESEYLRRRAAEVGYSAQVLFQELRRREYRGSYETVKRFVRPLRETQLHERSLLGRLGKMIAWASCRRPGRRLPPRSPGRRPGNVSGDLPFDQPSCMIPGSLPGAMPAMRRRARRFTSFARTDTAVHGGGRSRKRERIGICTLCAPYASSGHGGRGGCAPVSL